ncbi:MAG: carbohydrate-binding protein, partial [Dermatophilaceae bacterium]
RAGSPDSPALGQRTVPTTKDWETYTILTIPVEKPGEGQLVLTFSGGTPGNDLLDIDSFTVER